MSKVTQLTETELGQDFHANRYMYVCVGALVTRYVARIRVTVEGLRTLLGCAGRGFINAAGL